MYLLLLKRGEDEEEEEEEGGRKKKILRQMRSKMASFTQIINSFYFITHPPRVTIFSSLPDEIPILRKKKKGYEKKFPKNASTHARERELRRR